MSELLTGPEARLARFRAALLEALGPNGSIITDVLPEIEMIIGPQPAIQKLEPKETRNRFNRVLRGFIQVLARPEHPLLLFIDDLQWADRASLRLFQVLMTEDQPDHLMVVGAYRDEEVGLGHPLPKVLSAMEQAGVAVRSLTLGPIDSDDIARLVADTLSCEASECTRLAALVFRNTEGNPLFVREFRAVL